MKYIYQNQDVTGQQFTDENGIQYPSNFCDVCSQEDKDNLSIISLEEIYQELSSTEKYDGTFTDEVNGLVGTRTYNKVNKTSEEINAPILEQIRVIEAGQMRSVREVALGIEGGIARLQAIETEIVRLRSQLIV